MHRDKFYGHVQEEHHEIRELSDYVFYNENLQIANLDYFKVTLYKFLKQNSLGRK